MKDYSSYHNYNPLKKRLSDGKKIFEVSKRGINSYKGIVDKTVETDIIVEKAYNPYSEKREERIFKCDLQTEVELGSEIYLEETKQTFIAVTDVNTNRIFKSFMGVELNYTLNWVGETGDLNSVLCHLYEKDVYSIGVKEIKFIPTLHEQLFITLQQDKYTRSIERGTRFIIDGYAWEVTNINSALGKLMKLAIKEVTTDRDDNIEDEIPNEDNIKGYSIDILNGDSIKVSLDKTFKIMAQVKKGDSIVKDAIVKYSSQDPLVASVNELGVVKGIEVGSTVISVKYNNIETIVDVSVESLETITYRAMIKGDSSVRSGRQSNYIYTITANGEALDSASAEWSVSNEDGGNTDLVSIRTNKDKSCTLIAPSRGEYGFITLTLRATIEDEIIETSKQIEVKSILAP